eukprot:3725625-Prorocentrum_lima.AAC.1
MVVQLAWSTAYLAPSAILTAGMRVRTPYGEGVMLSTYHYTAGEDKCHQDVEDGRGDHDGVDQVRHQPKKPCTPGQPMSDRNTTILRPGGKPLQ